MVHTTACRPRANARAERLWFRAAAVACLAGLAACATSGSTNRGSTTSTAPRAVEPERPTGGRRFFQEGRASYYADKFAGRRTASGERYDPERMTAAHQTLPLGTWIRVTRVDDGRSVEVRINDRCGCGSGRIVDLSRHAARRLDMLHAGVVPVRIEVLRK
jgi:rare lipoprotein A